MEGLIQTRFNRSDSDEKFTHNAFFLTADHSMDRGQGRPLRRASAIEGDLPTPCLSQVISLEDNVTPALEEEEEEEQVVVETTTVTQRRLTGSQNSLLPNPETMC
ncbi:hypothetical protein J6590_005555 [Homalodisca vitripennis]|nr:hypothetical protein J6590_005555 [Homalodisca vitripennis]